MQPDQAPFAFDPKPLVTAPAALVGPAPTAYRLQVREAQITISAAEPAGAFSAVQTLLQMLPKASAPASKHCSASRRWTSLTRRASSGAA